MRADLNEQLPRSVTIRLGRRKMCLTWRRRVPAPRLLRNLLRRSLRHLFAMTPALVGAWCGHVLAAQPAPTALPAGAQLAAGAATVSQSGSSMRVAQASDKAILNWGSFNIGSQAAVHFQQPGAGSVALNRVLGNDPSALLGTLSANGSVWLINPAGILVGPGARIDVAGFIGSTLNIRNEDFLAGRLNFQAGAMAGDIANQGRISAARGGSVYLIAPGVENSGVINAPAGEILLAAGRQVQLADTATPGVQIHISSGSGRATNLGEIVSEAGRVGLAGALLKNTGVISASSAVQDGGRVFLQASRGIELGASSIIAADGLSGGSVSARVTQAGRVDGSMRVDGSLSAKGIGSGDGGKVETSAGSVSVAAGTSVNTASGAGRTGEWLIDPTDLTIGNVDGAPSAISASTLSANLQTSNVTLDTSSGAEQNGDISVDAPVSWTSANSLALNAIGGIRVAAPISGPQGTVTLRPDFAGSCRSGANSCSTVVFAPGGSVTAATTTIYYNVQPNNTDATDADSYRASVTGNLIQWQLVNDLQQLSRINPTVARNYALGRDINGLEEEFIYEPIGSLESPFRGTLDGNGRVISNLRIPSLFSNDVGLVSANSGTLQNLRVENATVLANSNAAVMAGQNNAGGRILNVSVTGSVDNAPSSYGAGLRNDRTNIGGLAGINRGVIANSANGASISGIGVIGGLVGTNENGGQITSSSNSGSVATGRNEWINGAESVEIGVSTDLGGLAGINRGTIVNSFNTGTVTGSNVVGGVAGTNAATGIIDASYNTGIASNAGVPPASDVSRIGGVAGSNEGRITRSMSNADIVGNNVVGGLVGENGGSGAISNAYSAGSVTSRGISPSVGGFAGQNFGAIASVHTTSEVNSFYGGGLVGSSPYGGVIDGFWDLANYPVSSAGTGLTAQQMMRQSSYTGFDFATVWRIYDGNTVPLLRNFLTPVDVSAAPVTRVYNADSTPFTGTPTITGLTDGGEGLRGALSYGDAVNAGSYSLTGLWSTIYDIRYLPGSELTITPAPVQISGVAANGKTYDGTRIATLSGTPTVQGLGEDSLSLSGAGTALFNDKNVGTGKTVTLEGYVLGGASAGNYTLLPSAGLTADITPLTTPILVPGVESKDYDGTRNASLRQPLSINALPGDDVFIANPGIALFSDKNAGIGKVVSLDGLALGGADARNYVGVPSGPLLADIRPAPLAVTGLAANGKVYDASTLATLSGAPAIQAFGTDVVVLAGAAEGRFADKNVGVAKPVTVSGLGLSGADAGNYRLVQPAGLSADIAPAPLAVAGIGAVDKQFDGSVAAQLTGAPVLRPLEGDQVVLTGTGFGRFLDPSVGSRKPVVVSGYELGGADAGNYVLRQPEGVTASITQAPVPPQAQAPSAPNSALVAAIDRTAAVLSPRAAAQSVQLPDLSILVDKSPPLAKAPQRFLAMEEQRRKERTALYAQALAELKNNPEAADLRPCPEHARPTDLCMPAPLAPPEARVQAGPSPATTAGSPGEQAPAPSAPADVPASPAVAEATATPLPAQATPQRVEVRRKIAFLIGNNAYKRPIPRLLTPIGDMKAVATELRDQLGYEVNVLPNATRAEVIRLFKSIADAAERDDSVLVFYAGHGYETDDKKGYWIPVDGSPDDPTTWISNSDIAKLLARVPAKQVILIADSCYSGTLASEQRLDPKQMFAKRDEILRKRSVTVMSSGGDEPVSDKGKEGHSIFAWSLLNEMRRIAGPEQGVNLFEQVRARVVDEYPQTPQYGAMISAGHDAGSDYLLEGKLGN